MKTKKSKKKTLPAFVDALDRMKHTPFCAKNLIRKVSPWYKTTTHSCGKVFSLRNKVTGASVRLHIYEENEKVAIDVRFSSKWGEGVTFLLYVKSNKHLLTKLLEHNLI